MWRYSRMAAAPNTEPDRNTTARITMTLGLAQPASSRCSIRPRLELLALLRVRGKVHQYNIALVRRIAGNGNVSIILFCYHGLRPQVPVFPFHTHNPGP